MSTFNSVINEVKFTSRDRALWFWIALVFCLSTLSVGFGLVQVDRQNQTIQHLLEADEQERLALSKKVKSWGSAAYYNFHLTYEPPSDFAYASMGLRESQPWKHRIRMLALEGQIYERDVGNPSVALIGRLDFAFFAAFIFPLVLIMLLYDLKTGEKTAGRYALLEATAGNAATFWLLRAGLRSASLYMSLILPLIIAGLIAGTELNKLFLACLWVLGYTIF